MANRVIRAYNQILTAAQELLPYYSRQYLDAYTAAPIRLASWNQVEIEAINMYYTLSGFHLYGESHENANDINNLARLCVNHCYQQSRAFVFAVDSNQGTLKVFWGTNHHSAPALKTIISANLEGASVHNTGQDAQFVNAVSQYTGLITGIPNLECGDIDLIINSISNKCKCRFAFLGVPIDNNLIHNEIGNLNEIIRSVKLVSKRNDTFGGGRQRIFEHEHYEATELLELCEKLKLRLNEGLATGLWHSCIWFGADTNDAAMNLASVISGALQKNIEYNQDNYWEIPRIFFTGGTGMYCNSRWRMPLLNLYTNPFESLFQNSLATVVSSNELASQCQLPIQSHKGYFVRHMGESLTSQGGFDKVQSAETQDNGILLGKLNEDNYFLPVEILARHALISGSTGSGKTTTVKRILTVLNKLHIPFIVLESAKKEYAELTKIAGMEKLKVYSSGGDALPLKINPFEPEDGTLLTNHIEALTAAFTSLFDGEDPIPLAISELVQLSYKKRGWDTSKRADINSEKPWPIIQDMLDHLDECIDSIGYGPEVRDNVRGAVRLRLRSLTQGHIGAALNTYENISINEFYRNSAVIDLDDFVRAKSFIAGIIAIKVGQHARKNAVTITEENEHKKLHRLLVIEEAHHLLPDSSQPDISKARGEAAGYFTHMLSEIRSYGTGLIIADQSPAYISRHAIGNTAVKIIHNLNEGDDIKAIKTSLGFKEHQIDHLRTLKPGEAIVSISGEAAVNLVKLSNEFEFRADNNLACLFCDRSECDYSAEIRGSSAYISDRDRNYIRANGISPAVFSRVLKDIETRVMTAFPPFKKLCIAGLLAESATENQQLCKEALFDYVHSERS